MGRIPASRLSETPLYQSTAPEDILRAWTLLQTLKESEVPTPGSHTLKSLGSWFYAAQLLIQSGEGELDDLLPPGSPPSLEIILRAQELLKEPSLNAAREILEQRILALPDPLADLMVDLDDLPAKSWYQVQQTIERWELTEEEAPTIGDLDFQKFYVRNGLLDRIRSETSELNALDFTTDLQMRLITGKILQLDVERNEAFGTKPVFSFTEQKGVSSLHGFFSSPSNFKPSTRYLTPIAHPDPDKNWTREELGRTGFMMLLELPIAITSAITHQLACNPGGLIPDDVHAGLQQRLGGEPWDRGTFIDLYRRYVLAHEWGHHAHRITRPGIPGISENSWHSEYDRLAGEAWADHAALRLVLPKLDEQQRVHFEFQACRRFYTIEEDRAEVADSMHELADALFYPALLSKDPVATHRGYLERIAELCQAADKAGTRPDPLPLVNEIMDSVGRP